MTNIEKTLRDKLLNMDTQDGMSSRILRQNLLELEGRLSVRKRIENGILAIIGGFFAFGYLFKVRGLGWRWDIHDAYNWVMVSGAALSVLWVAVTGWQAVKGRCNDRWHPPLKATGILGTLCMTVAAAWLIVVAPRVLMETRQEYMGHITTLASTIVVGIMTVVCLVAVLAVYWRICREGAMIREKMVEMQCMIAELQEKK